MGNWLAEQGFSIDDFEASLERQLLINKLKDRFTADDVAQRFASRNEDYACVHLRQIVVDREDLANELLSQIRDDGRDFSELARSHSIDRSLRRGGLLGELFCDKLPVAIGKEVCSAQAGQTIGPFASAEGFCLFLVESRIPAQLDAATAALIRGQLFDEWVASLLAEQSLSIPLLPALRDNS